MPALAEIEGLFRRADLSGEVNEKELEVFLRAYTKKAERLYQSALEVTSQMYDRQAIPRFWQDKLELLQAQLAILTRFQNRLSKLHSKVDTAPFIRRFEDLITACSIRFLNL
jgi:hypothetical protein